MDVSPCKPYHSRTSHVSLLRMPDGVSAFKVYYVSIVGRDEPSRYEWEHSAVTPDAFEALLNRSGVEGIGFVTAFPHITKVFRFAPAMETVLHVKALNTSSLGELTLERGDAFVEFACYAEAAIAADEYHAWAAAQTVDEYLAYRSPFADGPVANPDKLAAHVARHRT